MSAEPRPDPNVGWNALPYIIGLSLSVMLFVLGWALIDWIRAS